MVFWRSSEPEGRDRKSSKNCLVFLGSFFESSFFSASSEGSFGGFSGWSKEVREGGGSSEVSVVKEGSCWTFEESKKEGGSEESFFGFLLWFRNHSRISSYSSPVLRESLMTSSLFG